MPPIPQSLSDGATLNVGSTFSAKHSYQIRSRAVVGYRKQASSSVVFRDPLTAVGFYPEPRCAEISGRVKIR